LAEDNRIMQPPRYPMPGMGLYFVGTEGTLALEASKDLSVSVYNADGLSYPGSHVYVSDLDDNFAGEIRHFARCILGIDSPFITLEHSSRVLQAVLCAADSFEKDKELEVEYA
jgi:predicted dehydrogenase